MSLSMIGGALFLGRLSGAPLYAKLLMMVVLGGGTGILINEAGVRSFRNRRQGKLLLAAGLLCLTATFFAAILIS